MKEIGFFDSLAFAKNDYGDITSPFSSGTDIIEKGLAFARLFMTETFGPELVFFRRHPTFYRGNDFFFRILTELIQGKGDCVAVYEFD